MWLVHFWWWFQAITGTDNTAGRPYGFWSGWGSVFVLPVMIGISHYIVDRWINQCHVDGCYRKGNHPVDGTPYKVCKKHHPDVPEKITHLHIVKAHSEAKKSVLS